ncbi:hypothetical protein [Azospirillum sp. B4]|uniref:hypothetical protein n=1 Tax=Azospirillum sp. B4 TaxID=95605 RepID=UPI00034A676E|nr:hypothetical protein [Azospirillum sp. B4]
MTRNPSDLDAATAIAARIEAKAVALLAPLEREMALMSWRPEFKAIMWAAVAIEAQRRADAQSS